MQEVCHVSLKNLTRAGSTYRIFLYVYGPTNKTPIMFKDTGTLSFWLYVIIIAITALASWAIIRLILKSTDSAKAASITEVFKYFIGSVCLVALPAIILNLLNERDQDLEELKYFDTHTTTITAADGNGRYQLARFIATAAPEGELKQGWKAYYKLIKEEHAAYLAAKSEKLAKDPLKTMDHTREAELDAIIESYETPILATEQLEVLNGKTPSKK